VKHIRGNLDASRVDKIMDDIEEEKELSDQISDAITRPAQDMFDDDELLAELEELEELERQEMQAPVIPAAKASQPAHTSTASHDLLSSLPEAPSTIIVHESEEEAALRALQASMMS
jgi:charged multivesicular body protein 4A/B